MNQQDSLNTLGDLRVWDVVIVGAGPAGSMAALELAGPDLSVLLVDRAPFPRHKVCGCCLNGVAVARLEEAGIRDLPESLGARPLREFRLMSEGIEVPMPMRNSLSISRRTLDLALARAAVTRGATFLSGTHARLEDIEGDQWQLRLRSSSAETVVKSRLVLCADGLAGSCLTERQELASDVSPRARVGVSAILDQFPEWIRDGVLYMAVGPHGYVGLVRLEDRMLNIAAALDPGPLSQARGPSPLIEEIFREAGLPPFPCLGQVQWKGTAPLTRRRSTLGAERLLILGDAAGYVEPFTGEGIAWALTSGQLVAPVARAALERWDCGLIDSWERIYRRFLGRRQRICRVLSGALRKRALYSPAIQLLRSRPAWGIRVMEQINRVEWKGSVLL